MILGRIAQIEISNAAYKRTDAVIVFFRLQRRIAADHRKRPKIAFHKAFAKGQMCHLALGVTVSRRKDGFAAKVKNDQIAAAKQMFLAGGEPDRHPAFGNMDDMDTFCAGPKPVRCNFK